MCRSNKGVKMKQITIYDLLPLLRNGWVAMEKNGDWYWYKRKPFISGTGRYWCADINDYEGRFYKLNGEDTYFIKKIKRFKGDWKNSLIKVEHKEEE